MGVILTQEIFKSLSELCPLEVVVVVSKNCPPLLRVTPILCYQLILFYQNWHAYKSWTLIFQNWMIYSNMPKICDNTINFQCIILCDRASEGLRYLCVKEIESWDEFQHTPWEIGLKFSKCWKQIWLCIATLLVGKQEYWGRLEMYQRIIWPQGCWINIILILYALTF